MLCNRGAAPPDVSRTASKRYLKSEISFGSASPGKRPTATQHVHPLSRKCGTGRGCGTTVFLKAFAGTAFIGGPRSCAADFKEADAGDCFPPERL